MRTPSLNAARAVAAVTCVCVLTACGADVPTTSSRITPAPAPPLPVLGSVRITVASFVEPLESASAVVSLTDTQNRSMSSSGKTVVWSSSDSAVASFSASSLVGHRPGDITVTASVDGVSGTAAVHVAWRSDATLVISSPHIHVQALDHVVFLPTTRPSRRVPRGDLQWSSSNPLVARMDSPGTFTTLAPGSTTVIGSYLGLADTVIVDVDVAPSGFGYFYSADAPVVEWYDSVNWKAAPARGFSSDGTVSANWAWGDPSQPDLGWAGPTSPARDAVLHTVPLWDVSCTSYIEPDTGYSVVIPGAPVIACASSRASAYPVYEESSHLEFVAFRPGEFSGTLAFVRPSWAPISTAAGGISETSPKSDSREYTMPGVAPDSLYWFVTPAAWNVGACAIALTNVTRVNCDGLRGVQAEAVVFAMGFGSDVRRGTAPIGFAKVGGDVAVVRKMVGGLDITTSGASLRAIDVVVSGAAMAAFNRIPAVLVTAIAPTAARCFITEPARMTSTTVVFRVTCPVGVTGVMLGAMY